MENEDIEQDNPITRLKVFILLLTKIFLELFQNVVVVVGLGFALIMSILYLLFNGLGY